MRERVDLVRLEPPLLALRDHPRIEIDPVRPDPVLLEELQEDALPRAKVEHALAAFEEIEERLGLAANDGIVAAKTRLEVHRVEVRRGQMLAPLLEIALELFEPRTEARRHLTFVVVSRGEQVVHAFLPLEDRAHPPFDEPDRDAARERDERTDNRLAAARVVLDLRVERLGERSERILEIVGEDATATGKRDSEERLDVRAVDAFLALLADALAHLRHDGIKVDSELVAHSGLTASSRSRRSTMRATRYAGEPRRSARLSTRASSRKITRISPTRGRRHGARPSSGRMSRFDLGGRSTRPSKAVRMRSRVTRSKRRMSLLALLENRIRSSSDAIPWPCASLIGRLSQPHRAWPCPFPP